MIKLPARLFLALLSLAAAASAAEPQPAAAYTTPPYPAGFLQWTPVRTTTLDPKDPATAKLTDAHFVYANDKAMAGLRNGHFPEGAAFVLDIIKVEHKDGDATLGARASTSSMVRDQRAKETGGWAFGDFDIVSTTALKMNAVSECFQCHTRKSGHEYVFTTLKP